MTFRIPTPHLRMFSSARSSARSCSSPHVSPITSPRLRRPWAQLAPHTQRAVVSLARHSGRGGRTVRARCRIGSPFAGRVRTTRGMITTNSSSANCTTATGSGRPGSGRPNLTSHCEDACAMLARPLPYQRYHPGGMRIESRHNDVPGVASVRDDRALPSPAVSPCAMRAHCALLDVAEQAPLVRECHACVFRALAARAVR